MAQESNLTIQFPVRMTNDETGFTYVDHPSIHASVYASSMNSAKSKLRTALQSEIEASLVQVQNYQQKFIGCADGTILLVQFRYGHWGYEIAGPNRNHCSSVSDSGNFNETCADARNHAESSYGGVKWELS